MENLLLYATMAHLDASFDKYNNAPCYVGQTVADGCIDPDGPGPATATQNLNDKTLQYAPNWAFTANAEYSW